MGAHREQLGNPCERTGAALRARGPIHAGARGNDASPCDEPRGQTGRAGQPRRAMRAWRHGVLCAHPGRCRHARASRPRQPVRHGRGMGRSQRPCNTALPTHGPRRVGRQHRHGATWGEYVGIRGGHADAQHWLVARWGGAVSVRSRCRAAGSTQENAGPSSARCEREGPATEPTCDGCQPETGGVGAGGVGSGSAVPAAWRR
jgi:hypothetical protein